MENLDLIFVEDSASDAFMIKRILKKEVITDNYQWFQDGEKAIDFFKNREIQNLSLVLLDVKMPKISGFDILEKIKQNEKTKNIPVVMLSSSEERKDIEQAYLCGANGYLTKPKQFSELKETIRLVTNYWLNLNKT
ncbi:MAG: response regulator [Bacteroidota bacterium]